MSKKSKQDLPEPAPGEYFKSRLEALSWLQQSGYKVSRGKFYGDCKKGFPVIQKDGSISKYQTVVYGNRLQDDLITDPTALESSEYRHQREKAEAKMAEIKAEKMQREASDEWINRTEAYAMLAAITGAMRDSARQWLYRQASEIVLAAGGDHDRLAEAYELMEQAVDAAYNEVAGSEVSISFDMEGE